MRILVLGASGYLGENVYQQLYKNDYDVLGTFNTSLRKGLIQLSMLEKEAVNQLMISYDPQVIIWCIKEDGRDAAINGLNHVLDAILPNARLIYLSTDGFVGGQGNYREDTVMNCYRHNPLAGYVNHKIDSEKCIIAKHANQVIIRTGPIYGKNGLGNWDKRITELIVKLSRKEKIYRASNLYKTFVHIEDLTNIIIELSTHEYRGIVHVGPETKESYYRFNKKIAHQLGLDDTYIIENKISIEDAKVGEIPLDTSMVTTKCRSIFYTDFRSVSTV